MSRQRSRLRWMPMLIGCCCLVAGATFVNAADSGTALRMQLTGAIGPISGDYVLKGIEQAEQSGANLIILEMDTPGGLDTAMRVIIKGILGSDVPFVTFVSPSGSRAASAGTYILYASHVAAMAPATNLGAATPVQIGGDTPVPESPFSPEQDEDQQETEQDQDNEDSDEAGETAAPLAGSAMERKVVNDAVAYIRGLAELRGRNADWAEQAVREAVSLTAEEALAENVIDIVAVDVADLLASIDGMTVEVNNEPVQIAAADLVIEEYEPDWRTRLLMVVTDPNIAYLLMLVGIYGLILEGYNPGALIPGVVGAICLLLALFAFQVLPINYAGLALIALGVALMIAEAFAPSFGVLGLGGIVAFVFGSVILMDSDIPGFGISRALIGTVAAVGGMLLLTMVVFMVRSRRRPVVSGTEGMLDELAEALEDFSTTGEVFMRGERWHARTSGPVVKGQSVRVKEVRGLLLEVEPQDIQT